MYLYIKIGLSRCVSTAVAWMDLWSDDVRRPAAGAGEGREGGTVRHGLRGAQVQADRADGQAGRHASRRPKSSQNHATLARFI